MMHLTDTLTDTCCLKVDVDTHDGMRDGVPRLLDAFRVRGVRATFFLSFGPDNAGKAIWRVLCRRGFLAKMLRTRAPALYGWRTLLSGTLLPARMIAVDFADLVRRIAEEGHEIGVHAWDHRRWQDHLVGLTREEVRLEFVRAIDAYDSILRRPPCSVAAPAWNITPTSLAVQDDLGLLYASDVRGTSPCFVGLDGRSFKTLQIPTTQPCLDEILVPGARKPDDYAASMLASVEGVAPRVVTLHAEVEGRLHEDVLHALLARISQAGLAVRTLEEVARTVHSLDRRVPTRQARACTIPGRPGRVFVAR